MTRKDFIAAALAEALSPTEVCLAAFLALYPYKFDGGHFRLSRARAGATIGRAKAETIGKAARRLEDLGFIWLDQESHESPFEWNLVAQERHPSPIFADAEIATEHALAELRHGKIDTGAANTYIALAFIADEQGEVEAGWEELLDQIPGRSRNSLSKDLTELEFAGLIWRTAYQPQGERQHILRLALQYPDEPEPVQPAPVPQEVINARQTVENLTEGLRKKVSENTAPAQGKEQYRTKPRPERFTTK